MLGPLLSRQRGEVLRRILPGLQLVPAHQIRELPNDNAVWLWNSQPISGESVSIGEPVDSERLAEIPLGEPLRLVRIEPDLWSQALAPDLQAPNDIQLPDDAISADDRYSDLLPAPEGSLQITDPVISGSGRKRIPEVTGTGSLGQTMACLEMLARYYNVPFRRDVIERAATDNLRGRSNTSLELIGSLSTVMGFTGTLTDLPEGQLGRAPFPAIAWVMDQPSIIHDISSKGVKAVVPEYGRVILPLSELLGDQAGARLLLLQPGRDSHAANSVCHGFFPRSVNIVAA